MLLSCLEVFVLIAVVAPSKEVVDLLEEFLVGYQEREAGTIASLQSGDGYRGIISWSQEDSRWLDERVQELSRVKKESRMTAFDFQEVLHDAESLIRGCFEVLPSMAGILDFHE